MPVSNSNQAYVFLCSLIGGMIIAFVYDTFRIKRKIIHTGKFALYLEDLLFWVMVALIMFMVIYYSNDGEIRGYIFIGNLLGVFIYLLIFSKIIVVSMVFFLETLMKFLKILWLTVTYPLRVMIRILAIPGRFLRKIISGWIHRIRVFHRIKISRLLTWVRIIKNYRKKV